MSPDEFRAYKLNTRCSSCVNHGHWATYHLHNGTIKYGLPNIAPSTQPNSLSNSDKYNNESTNKDKYDNNNQQGTKPPRSSGNVLNFMGCLITNNVSSNSKNPSGPLVDDGAPFSAIGMTELRLLRHIDTSSSIKLEPIPTDLSYYKWWQFGTGQTPVISVRFLVVSRLQ